MLIGSKKLLTNNKTIVNVDQFRYTQINPKVPELRAQITI